MCKTVYILCFVVCLSCCNVFEAEGKEGVEKDLLEQTYKHDKNMVTIPVYVIYLFGFGLVLLILILIFLIFVLMKTKFLTLCNKGANSIENAEVRTLNPQETRQKSLKRLNLDGHESFEFKNKGTQGKYQTLNENESTDTLKSTKYELNTPRTQPASSGNISPRIIKGLTKDMPVILPEQMSEICKEVLKRTNKNEDAGCLSASDQDLVLLAKETTLEEENEKKCGSSPILDIYYDVPPSTLKNDKKSNEKAFGSQTLNNGNDIYDMPKELNGAHVEDDISKHLLDDNVYDKPKESDHSNKEDENSKTNVSSNNLYDLPKELINNSINYVKPYFSPTSDNRKSAEIKASFKKPDYAILNESCVKENSTDKMKIPQEHDAYEFPKNTSTEGQMYINANEVIYSV